MWPLNLCTITTPPTTCAWLSSNVQVRDKGENKDSVKIDPISTFWCLVKLFKYEPLCFLQQMCSPTQKWPKNGFLDPADGFE